MKNKELYKNIKQISNKSKFRILEATQEKELDITELSKIVKIAFNKCSSYCIQLEKANLVIKHKKGINTFIKPKIFLKELEKLFNFP